MKKSKIDSNFINKFIIKNDDKFYLDLPQVGKFWITIFDKDFLKIDYNLYVRDNCKVHEYIDDAENNDRNENLQNLLTFIIRSKRTSSHLLFTH